MSTYKTPEQRALDAEHQTEQIAHKLNQIERRRESAELMAHKVAWIAVFQAMAILLLTYKIIAEALA